jgi:hypothetical protein
MIEGNGTIKRFEKAGNVYFIFEIEVTIEHFGYTARPNEPYLTDDTARAGAISAARILGINNLNWSE